MDPDVAKRLSGIEERLRILESKVEELSSRFKEFRRNVIRTQREHSEKIKDLIRASAALNSKLKEIKENLKRIEFHLLKVATKAELKEIEAYLELLAPLRFVTREEVEKIISEKLR